MSNDLERAATAVRGLVTVASDYLGPDELHAATQVRLARLTHAETTEVAMLLTCMLSLAFAHGRDATLEWVRHRYGEAQD